MSCTRVAHYDSARCAQCNRILNLTVALRESMHNDRWNLCGKELDQKFDGFCKLLNWLVESEAKVSCREGTCDPPFCTLRKSARDKNVDVCPLCEEHPSDLITGFAEGYVTLLADGKRMTDIGLDRWIEDQVARKSAGFANVDIRFYPYHLPDN